MEFIKKYMINSDNTLITKIVNFIIILLILLVMITRYDLNPDIYFMINHGKYIVQNGFTNIEPFTVHEGLSFQFEKWFTCVVSYLVYEKFGMIGLNIIMYILIIITWIVLYKVLKSIGNNRMWISALPISFYIAMFLSKRPGLITNILILIEFYFLEKYTKSNQIKYLFPLPLISLIISNTHSTTFLIFYLVFLPFMFQNLKISTSTFEITNKLNKKRLIELLICGVISFLTSLINPHGINSFTYMINSYFSDIRKLIIGELKPLSPDFEMGFTIVVLLLILHLIRIIRKPQIIPVRYVLLFYGFLVFAFTANRNIQYFLLFSGVMLTFNYKNVPKKNIELHFRLIPVLLLLLFIMIDYNYNQNKIVNYQLFSQGNERYIELINNTELKDHSKVFSNPSWGAYYQFKGHKTYIDPRAELFDIKINKEKDIISEFLDIAYGKISIEEIQELYDFDYYHVFKNNIVYYQLNNSEIFTLIAEDDESAIFSSK